MNDDFTKEELEEIKRCLKYMINGGITPYSNLTISTKKKVQNMIYSYCDHEFMTDCFCPHSKCQCEKCGKII